MPISSRELKQHLLDAQRKLSGHQDRAGELHMSQLWLPVEQIIHEVLNGKPVREEEFQKFYQGNVIEASVIDLLLNTPLQNVRTKVKLTAHDGLLQGEIDAVIDDSTVVEVKSVPNDQVLEEKTRDNRVVEHVFAQINCYMYYGRYRNGIVIYVSRSTGKIWTLDIRPDQMLQEKLAAKAALVLTNKDVYEALVAVRDANQLHALGMAAIGGINELAQSIQHEGGTSADERPIL